MNLANPFSKETKELFYRGRYCLLCGRTDFPIELHHITGRDSSSPFNCCRICKECHGSANHTPEDEIKFFLKTYRFLLSQKYQMTDDDKQFLLSHPHLLLCVHS